MGENLHDIDKLFKDGIGSYEEAPAPTSWNSIENNLDKEDTVRLRRTNRFLKRGALALIVFLGISLILLYKYTNKDNQADLTIQPSQTITDSLSEKTIVSKEEKENNNNTDKQDNLTTTDSKSSPAEKEASTPTKEIPAPTTGNNKVSNTDNKKDVAVKEIDPAKTSNHSNDAAASETNKKKKEKIKESIVSDGTQKNSYKIKSSKDNAKHKGSVSDEFVSGNKKKNAKASQKNSGNLIQKDGAPAEDLASGKKVDVKKGSVAPVNNTEERKQSWTAFKGINMLDRSSIKPSGQFNSLAAASSPILPKQTSNKPHVPGNGSFAISLFYSPNMNIQNVQDGERKHMEDDRNSIREGEKVKSSASYGITGSYSFNKKWAVQVGLQVFKQTSIIEPKNLFARHDDRRGNPPNSGELRYKFNCAAGYVFLDPKSGTTPAFGDSVTALRSENTLSYTGIPVTVQYSTQLGKFKLNGVAGLGFNILSKSELQSNFIAATGVKTQSVDQVQGLKSMYVSGIIGAGLEYPLSQRLSAYVLPNLSFSVSPINKNTPALTKLNTFGLQTGLKFRL